MRKIFMTLILLGTFFSAYNQIRSIRVLLPEDHGILMENTRAILVKQIADRAIVRFVNDSTAEYTIELARENKSAPESFRIVDKGRNHIQIIGNDDRGVLYGVGRFLRTSRYDQKGFTPGLWRGTSVPKGVVRGMYFATHFNNFYEAAPIEDVQKYVEELALWGVNNLVIHFANWQFTSFYDVDAQKSLTRMRQILGVAKACGMKAGILQAPNQGFRFTNHDFINVPVPDALGRRGHFGVNLDPSHAGAAKRIKENWAVLLDQFSDLGLDLVVYWPYDEGGCGCDRCWPWGARGYPKLSRELTAITKEKYPDIEVVLSTWMYDTPPAGEWEGLNRFLQNDSKWLDYIMADSHEDFPRYPLDRGVPGKLPLLNFPEISMWGQGPWGGYGANPLTSRLQRLWNQTGNKLRGGFPYSEGIYEDMNKVICTQLYWDGSRSASDIIREYIAYEFSPDVVKDVIKAIDILESNHIRGEIKSSAREAFALMNKAEQKLTPEVRRSWRWRILFLRALIDREIFERGGKLEGAILKAAFEELTEIYHAQNAHSMPIRPPVIE